MIARLFVLQSSETDSSTSRTMPVSATTGVAVSSVTGYAPVFFKIMIDTALVGEVNTSVLEVVTVTLNHAIAGNVIIQYKQRHQQR